MSYTRLNPKLETSVESGTTSATGNLVASINHADYIIVAAIASSDTWCFCIPWAHPNFPEWRIKIMDNNTNAPIANTSVSVRIFYVSR